MVKKSGTLIWRIAFCRLGKDAKTPGPSMRGGVLSRVTWGPPASTIRTLQPRDGTSSSQRDVVTHFFLKYASEGSLDPNMPKRKAKQLDNDELEAPRRSSRRIPTANEASETSKPVPAAKNSKKTASNNQDEKSGVKSKQEESSESVSICSKGCSH